MLGIITFVGHSFAEEDKELIRRFLEYFTSLAGAVDYFSWDHAEEAEPITLTSKVMGIIEGKNTFIGICTKAEQVVVTEPNAPPDGWRSRLIRSRNPNLQWKTSDWIIQEIGLAIGRGLSVILLLEEGVRAPGG